VAFLVCYSRSPPDDHTRDKAIYLDQQFYELIFKWCRDEHGHYLVLREIALLKYKSPRLVVAGDRLALLDQELMTLEESGASHPQIEKFLQVCTKATSNGLALTISGDMCPELWEMHAPPRRRFRFSLRTLFVAVTVVALILYGGSALLNWYFSFPLADEVSRYNASTADTASGDKQPLTEDEVIAAIESQLPTLEAPERDKRIYRDIIRTRRLPRGGSLQGFVVHQADPYWAINLEVLMDEKSGFGLRIRETPITLDASPFPDDSLILTPIPKK
jgi:hypothetical protein